MKTMKTKHQSRRFRRFLRANEAVSALEYAILVGVVAVAIGAALVTFSGKHHDRTRHHWHRQLSSLDKSQTTPTTCSN